MTGERRQERQGARGDTMVAGHGGCCRNLELGDGGIGGIGSEMGEKATLPVNALTFESVGN